MALSPISFIATNYRDFKNEWLKAYEPGETTPKVMALDSAGDVTVAKLQLNADGFIVSAGQALVIPYIDGAYDLWLFPTEAEADANDTSNALRVADDIIGVSQELINDLSQSYVFETVAAFKASLIEFPDGKTIHLNDRDADFTKITGTGTANTYNIIASTDVNQSIELITTGYVTAINFGASPGVASQQHDALNAAITESAGKFKLFITPDAQGNQDYQVNSTVFMKLDDLNVEFTGGAHFFPEDSTVVQPFLIGTDAGESPSRMVITNPSVIRASTDLATANFGILFKQMNQCTITNPESRFCKFGLAWNPQTGGNEYNTYINPQATHGERNFWIEATSIGYVNENTFIGGRSFGDPNLETALYIGGSGLGTGHNRFIGLSLESSFGVQAIFDNGDANEFLQCRTENASGWTSGAAHVFGPGCQFPMIMTSRIDYDYDPTAASDPRAQIITYKQGTSFNTALNGVTTQTLKNQSASAGSTQDLISTRDNDDAYAFRAIRLIATESGTHDGADDASVLTDTGAAFPTSGDGLVGQIIFNKTDNSKAMITANTATTITANLLGGIGDEWDIGDTYEVNLLNGSLSTSGKLKIRRSIEVEQSGFNFTPFFMGSDYFWIDGNYLRHHGAEPAAATDGRIIVESQTSVAAGLGNIANVVNTTDKYIAKSVGDTGIQRPLWTWAATAAATWDDAAGAVVYTPV